MGFETMADFNVMQGIPASNSNYTGAQTGASVKASGYQPINYEFFDVLNFQGSGETNTDILPQNIVANTQQDSAKTVLETVPEEGGFLSGINSFIKGLGTVLNTSVQVAGSVNETAYASGLLKAETAPQEQIVLKPTIGERISDNKQYIIIGGILLVGTLLIFARRK
jgi:hypothetical protein